MTNRPDSGPDQAKAAWDGAVSLMTRAGVNEKQARSLFGKLLSAYKVSAEEMLPAVMSAEALKTQDPASYLTAAARSIAQRRVDPALKASWT